MDGPETASAVDTVLNEVVTTRLPLMEQDENQYHSVSCTMQLRSLVVEIYHGDLKFSTNR